MLDSEPGKVVILIPVWNDWETVALLLPSLDSAFAGQSTCFQVLLVDDGSVENPPGIDRTFPNLCAIEILRLRRNLGHQRAIAVGLVHICEHIPCGCVVVMDGDGEDRPQDIVTLLTKYHSSGGRNVIFAARAKRLESASFQISYHLYRVLHRLLTGIAVRVGNFSVIPGNRLPNLVVVSELWSHYAAAVFRAGIPYETIPIDRGKRLIGRSKMNFHTLLIHGLSAIAVFGDLVSARLLAVTAAVMVVIIGLISAVVAVRYATDLAIPGWATYTAGLLVVIFSQALMMAFLLMIMIVAARSNATFLPLRDTPWFVFERKRIYPT